MGRPLHSEDHGHLDADGHLLRERSAGSGSGQRHPRRRRALSLSLSSILVRAIPNNKSLSTDALCIARESDTDILIGWADSFRQIRVSGGASRGRGGRANGDGVERGAAGLQDRDGPETGWSAVTVQEWYLDCLLCGGVFPLDAHHVMALGYSPPDRDRDPSSERDSLTSRGAVEVLVLRRDSGEVVSADLLPLHWHDEAAGAKESDRAVDAGPWEYALLSSYKCRRASPADALDWDLHAYTTVLGGDRGKAPLSFIVSPQDLLVSALEYMDEMDEMDGMTLSHFSPVSLHLETPGGEGARCE